GVQTAMLRVAAKAALSTAGERKKERWGALAARRPAIAPPCFASAKTFVVDSFAHHERATLVVPYSARALCVGNTTPSEVAASGGAGVIHSINQKWCAVPFVCWPSISVPLSYAMDAGQPRRPAQPRCSQHA